MSALVPLLPGEAAEASGPCGLAPGWNAALRLWARLAGEALPETGLEDWLAGAFGASGAAAAGLATGYYEPVLRASRVATAEFAVPLLELREGVAGPLPDRAAIEAGALGDRARAIFWLADPVEAFFLQVQGSGRLRLPDGSEARVGYGGRNGHPYVSIGRLLAAEGALPPDGVTAAAVKAWLRADPARAAETMRRNPSFVFFRERTGLDPAEGPVGAMGVPLVARASLAVDPAHHPLGSLMRVEIEGAAPRLGVAMDTGSAIRGPGRCDLFFGSGEAAGLAAGRLAVPCRLRRLAPGRPGG